MPSAILMGLAMAALSRSASRRMNSRLTVSAKSANALVPSVSRSSKNEEKAERIPRAASSTTSP